MFKLCVCVTFSSVSDDTGRNCEVNAADLYPINNATLNKSIRSML